MKKSELRQIIKEELVKILNEAHPAKKLPNVRVNVKDWKEADDAMKYYQKQKAENRDVYDFGIDTDTYVLVSLPKGMKITKNLTDSLDLSDPDVPEPIKYEKIKSETYFD